jgi:hypothetical protein
MVGDLLDAMSGAHVPNYVMMVMQEVQAWLASVVSDDCVMGSAELTTNGEHALSGDLEYLFSQVEWAASYADVLPAARGEPSHEDALILSVGPIILDEGLRMLVDHAALFARGVCRRIWMVSDTWIIGDVLPYTPHIKALRERGIQTRFMLVTPWNCSEIPWNNVIKDVK